MAEFFGILSVSPVWLNSTGLIKNETDGEEAKIVSLMLTALDVLPRMAYYLTVDAWRMDAIQNKTMDHSRLTSNWWKYR